MSRTTSRFGLVLASLVAALLVASLHDAATVSATPYDWASAVSGSYQTPGNWSPVGIPTVGDSAHFGLTGTYTVGFAGSATTDAVLVDSSNTVTLNLAGNTFGVGTASSTNALDLAGTSTLIVSSSSGGTLTNNSGLGFSSAFRVGAGTTLKINDSLGTPVTFLSQGGAEVSGTMEVSGAGVVYNNTSPGVFWTLNGNSTLSVINGATFHAQNMNMALGTVGQAITVSGAGSQITTTGQARMIPDGGTIDIINGGTWQANSQFEMGVFFGPGGTVTVGNGVGSSLLAATEVLFGTASDPGRSFPKMIVNVGGTVRATTNTTNSFFVYDRGTATLNGGAIEIVANGQLNIADINNDNAEEGLFRGAGTISRFGAGANFTMTNDGDLDVGDTTGLPGTGSAIGTIALTNGNLVQNSGGSTYFDFDPTTSGPADLIDITAGTATIAGNVDFDATGILGLGTWDFVKASSITYTATDNMAALLTTLNPNPLWAVSFGVVTEGGFDYLRLSVEAIPAPEPSSFLLLGAGCLAVVCKRRRHRK